MFGPVAWLTSSSLKTPAALDQSPPTLLPYEPAHAAVPGRPGELPLFRVTAGEHAGRVLAEIRRVGAQSQEPIHPQGGDRGPHHRGSADAAA